MQFTDRTNGRKYVLIRKFVATGGTHMEASTGRRYNLVKRYI